MHGNGFLVELSRAFGRRTMLRHCLGMLTLLA
jgi:hypothetical protein